MKPRFKYSYIVMTPDILRGSPRLDGRRLAVGDIVSAVDLHEDLPAYLQEFELSMPEVKECLNYCGSRQCVADQPDKFCHNCTLRAQQDNDPVKDEQDNWLRAEKLYNKYFPLDTLA